MGPYINPTRHQPGAATHLLQDKDDKEVIRGAKGACDDLMAELKPGASRLLVCGANLPDLPLVRTAPAPLMTDNQLVHQV